MSRHNLATNKVSINEGTQRMTKLILREFLKMKTFSEYMGGDNTEIRLLS
jgi:hypothetical protein